MAVRKPQQQVEEPPSEDVLDYLEQVVARLERLGDRLEIYADARDKEPDEPPAAP